MKARRHFYVEGHTRGVALNEDEEPTTSDEPADTQVEEPSLYQKFEKFCSGFINDKHRERINEAERQYLGENIEDMGAPADVWEEQEDVFNTYVRSQRLSSLCLAWEERGFWEAMKLAYIRVMYNWTSYRDTLFDKCLPKSEILSYSIYLAKFIYYGVCFILIFLNLSIWIYFLVIIPFAFLLGRMCFAPRHEVYEKAFRVGYLEGWYEIRAQEEGTLSEEDVNGINYLI